MRLSLMTPDWLFQVMWFGAGVGGTGAVWHFLSQRSYHAALWTGFTTVFVVLLAITLHIRNDLLRGEQQTAASAPGPALERPALTNPSAAVTPSVPERPEESKANLEEKLRAEKETLIAPYPPVSTAQDMEQRQVLPDLTSDKASPAPERPTIREKSAAEIIVNLKRRAPSHLFFEKAKELYFGRWTREPGWQVIVHDLPSKRSEDWFCVFEEVGSGPIVAASTIQDLSALRIGDSATVSGRISDVSPLASVMLEDATVRGEHVPLPESR